MKTCLLIVLFLTGFAGYSQTTLVLVRHAEKVMQGDNPGLTDMGKARASALAAMLGPTPVDALYSTPYARTQQTLAPLAADKGLEIQEYPPVDTDKFLEILGEHEGETLVFSGHSNTIPMLLNLLTESETYQTFPEGQYDDLFIVTVYKGVAHVVPLKYGQPTPAE